MRGKGEGRMNVLSFEKERGEQGRMNEPTNNEQRDQMHGEETNPTELTETIRYPTIATVVAAREMPYNFVPNRM